MKLKTSFVRENWDNKKQETRSNSYNSCNLIAIHGIKMSLKKDYAMKKHIATALTPLFFSAISIVEKPQASTFKKLDKGISKTFIQSEPANDAVPEKNYTVTGEDFAKASNGDEGGKPTPKFNEVDLKGKGLGYAIDYAKAGSAYNNAVFVIVAGDDEAIINRTKDAVSDLIQEGKNRFVIVYADYGATEKTHVSTAANGKFGHLLRDFEEEGTIKNALEYDYITHLDTKQELTSNLD